MNHDPKSLWAFRWTASHRGTLISLLLFCADHALAREGGGGGYHGGGGSTDGSRSGGAAGVREEGLYLIVGIAVIIVTWMIIERRRGRSFFTAGGALVGAAVGIPLSYFFQAGLLREFMSMADYCSDIFSSRPHGSVGTLLATVAVMAIIGAAVGTLLLTRSARNVCGRLARKDAR